MNKGGGAVKKEELVVIKKDGAVISEIIKNLKNKGFELSDYDKGYLKCLLDRCLVPQNSTTKKERRG